MQPQGPGRPRVALVTGGASGIGLAVASALLDSGHRVTIADIDASAAHAAAATLGRAHPGRITSVVADVSEEGGARAAVRAAVEHHGALDLLHLNAGRPGVGVLGPDTDLSRARDVLVTNVMSAVAPLVAALPHLEDSPAAAVTITSSLAGLVASPADPIYAATKHALVGLVRSLAPAHPRTRINAVCPSLVDTAMIDGDLPAGHSLPVLRPEEVATAIATQLIGSADGEILFVEAGSAPTPVPVPHVSALQA